MIYDMEPYNRELLESREALYNELQDAIGGASPSLMAAIERFVDACIEHRAARFSS
jgi:hypothetical protein